MPYSTALVATHCERVFSLQTNGPFWSAAFVWRASPSCCVYINAVAVWSRRHSQRHQSVEPKCHSYLVQRHHGRWMNTALASEGGRCWAGVDFTGVFTELFLTPMSYHFLTSCLLWSTISFFFKIFNVPSFRFLYLSSFPRPFSLACAHTLLQSCPVISKQAAALDNQTDGTINPPLISSLLYSY